MSVVLKTDDNIIIGDFRVRPQNRIMDKLDPANPYLAVANAIMLDKSRKLRFKTHLMTINSQKSFMSFRKMNWIARGTHLNRKDLLSFGTLIFPMQRAAIHSIKDLPYQYISGYSMIT